jgi:hypothetical protein
MKAGLVIRVALVTTLMIAAACEPAQLASGGKQSLPTASATLHWAKVDLPRGSYCWRSGAQADCADSAGVDQLLRTGYLKPYRTAGGFDVLVNFHSASQPKGFHVQLIQSPTQKAVTVSGSAAPRTFSIGMIPRNAAGLYVYLVTATWDEGEVSYFLPLDLIPGGA